MLRPAVRTRIDPQDPFLHTYTKIIRLTFDPAKEALSDPVILIDGLPAGSDHNPGAHEDRARWQDLLNHRRSGQLSAGQLLHSDTGANLAHG